MAELRNEPSPCCAAEQHADCCAPSEKSACCGHGEGCDCGAGAPAVETIELRERPRERYTTDARAADAMYVKRDA